MMVWPIHEGLEALAPVRFGGPDCLSQLKQLTLGMIAYADDHHNVLPSATTWQRAITPYTHVTDERLIECVAPGEAGPVRHVMAARWSGVKLADIPDPASAILLYDAVDGRPVYRRRTDYTNLYERLSFALQRPRIGIAYVDGHCRWASDRLTPQMIAEGRDPFLAGRAPQQP
ncbi:MAG: hypothetical protein ABFD94_11000 [Armatimonadia bacterium]